MNKQHNDILESLIENTLSGDIQWKEYNTIFSSDTKHYYIYSTEDKETEFHLEISLDKSLSSVNDSCTLTIKNDDIIDNYLFLFSSKYKLVKDLSDIIFKSNIMPNIAIKKQDNVLDKIINSLGTKSSRRNDKLEKLLGDKNTQVKDNVKVESKIPFWKNLLKR
jgi:hypothetical protein